MTEAGVVINCDGAPIYWHLPPGRSSSDIPDSSQLWQVLWSNRQALQGFAHSHPGSGIPEPSHTDTGTFFAIERALGRRLHWWIASSDKLIQCIRKSDFPPTYHSSLVADEPSWAARLRQASFQ